MTLPTPTADEAAMREAARALGRKLETQPDAAPSDAAQMAESINAGHSMLATTSADVAATITTTTTAPTGDVTMTLPADGPMIVGIDLANADGDRAVIVDRTTGAVLNSEGDATDMAVDPLLADPSVTQHVDNAAISPGEGGRTAETEADDTGARALAFACGALSYGPLHGPVAWAKPSVGQSWVVWNEPGMVTMRALFPDEELADRFSDALADHYGAPTFGVSVNTAMDPEDFGETAQEELDRVTRERADRSRDELREAFARAGMAAETTGRQIHDMVERAFAPLELKLLREAKAERERHARRFQNAILILLAIAFMAVVILPGNAWPVLAVMGLCLLNCWNNARCAWATTAAFWAVPAVLGGFLLGGGL